MVAFLSKLKFFILQAICVSADNAVSAVTRLTGRQAHCEAAAEPLVFGSDSVREEFALCTLGSTTYTDPSYSGHVGTILCAFRPTLSIEYTRETVEGADGNPICLDWLLHDCPSEEAKGLLIIIPGLTSCSSTNYIERFVAVAYAQKFHCCVFNSRGLGNTPLEQPQLMSASWTNDLCHIASKGPFSLSALRQRFGSPLAVIGIGFSLGGVILSKYVGEQCRDTGVAPPFDAMVSVNSPLDSLATNDRMLTPLNRLLYQPSMTGGLVKYVRRHKEVLASLPGLSAEVRQCFANNNHENVFREIKTVYDFDTRISAPANGFASTEDYYREINSLKWISCTDIPTLCILAADDPVCGSPPRSELLSITKTNPCVGYLEIPHGGHLGYIKSFCDEWRGLPTFMETAVCSACTCATDYIREKRSN